MLNLTSHGQQVVADIALRHGVSEDAVRTLLIAVNAGYGTQAQFSHPELGGMGQWSRGGMIMVGDMFDNGLKSLVDQLCNDMSSALASGQIFQPVHHSQSHPSCSGQSQGQSTGFGGENSFSVSGGLKGGSGWPKDLGHPSSSGSQNKLRYAVFPETRRLAIDNGGHLTIYDIGDHQIVRFSQQQGGDQSITFTSQHGSVRVADLPLGGSGARHDVPIPPQAPTSAQPVEPPSTNPKPGPHPDEIFALIEQLAALHAKNILSDIEYETKKADLLARL